MFTFENEVDKNQYVRMYKIMMFLFEHWYINDKLHY